MYKAKNSSFGIFLSIQHADKKRGTFFQLLRASEESQIRGSSEGG